MKLAQVQMGSANLESTDIKGLVKSFIGKILQCIDMTHLPVGSKFEEGFSLVNEENIPRRIYVGIYP